MSNAKYLFFPGEYHITSPVLIQNTSNLTMMGYNTFSRAVIQCSSHSYVTVAHAHNVTIKMFAFHNCKGIVHIEWQRFETSLLIHVLSAM